MKPLTRTARRLLLSTVVLPLLWSVSGAQEATERQPLPFEVDYAKFRVSNELVQLEVYYSLFRNRLTFLPSEDQLEARFGVEVWISLKDSVVAQDNWILRSLAATRDEITTSQKVFTQTRFILPSGAYYLRTRVTDLNSGAYGEKAGAIRIAPIPSDTLCLSDIELSARISRDTLEAIYVKNGLTVVPNPGGVYGLPMPLLYSYCEIYNLYPSEHTYRVEYSILDENKTVIKKLPAKAKPKVASNLVEVGGINVASLARGRYFLRLTVTDEETGESASAQKRFYVYKETPPLEGGETADAEVPDWRRDYEAYTPEQLEHEFNAARYIATKEEREEFDGLSTQERREFLIDFWTRRDPSAGNVANEYRDDFLDRLQYAEENFGAFGPGWRSDRGRVLLIYGKPDEIERFPSSGGVRAYEIWRFFAIQGGVEFVFVDRKGWGDLQLVHSTARGEISDRDWTRWITTN